MSKTRLDVITRALRQIGVAADDETPTADQAVYVGDTLDALYAELDTTMVFPWELSAVPDELYIPFSQALAAEIAQHYGRPAEPRSRAIGRIRAYTFPDDREDRRDTDDDGLVSDEEIDADKRARYY